MQRKEANSRNGSPSRRRGSRGTGTTRKKERSNPNSTESVVVTKRSASAILPPRVPPSNQSACAESVGATSVKSRMSRVKAGRRSSSSALPARLDSTSEHSATNKKVNRPANVSTFLRATHKELKAKILKIQEHIRFIQDLAMMNDTQKIQHLFGMIDRDRGGTVDAAELAKAMRQNDELSFSDSIDRAIDMVARYDTDGDGELDVKEFEAYVVGMVGSLDMTSSEFCELIIVQLLLTDGQDFADEEEEEAISEQKIETEIKRRSKLFAFISDERVVALFEMFAGEGETEDPVEEVSFEAVAKACSRSSIARSPAIKDKEALELLLMTTNDDDRTLDLKQFGRLILSIVKMARTSFDDVAEALVVSLEQERDPSETLESSVTGDSGPMDTLTYRRLKKLFRLWDVDGDGDISATELSNGLEMFQKATGIKADAGAIADALIAFDVDGDGQLDPMEFSEAMLYYAKIQSVDLNLLIDFMCMVSSDSPQGEHTSGKDENGNKRGKQAQVTESVDDDFGSYEIDMWMD